MTGDVIIRPAVEDDAVAIHGLVMELTAFVGHLDELDATPDDIRRFGFGTQKCFDALIAERDGRPVGLCNYFYTFSSWRGRPGIFILDLVVSSTERGAGLGKRLLAETACTGKARGASWMQLSVHDGNDAALAIYQRLGFELVTGERLLSLETGGFEALAAQKL